MTRLFRAPGRVNLIGEHTDYNLGFVLPVALDLSCRVRARTLQGGQLFARSHNLGQQTSWALDGLASVGRREDWSDYVAGVAVELLRQGVRLVPAEIEIDSSVPLGAGLSSSAALEVSVALALSSLAGASLPKRELAEICQRAENEFVGMKCGIMDQFAAVFGAEDQALLVDCRSLDHRLVALPPEVDLVMVNSMVKHELASSEYNRRRQECEAAAERLGKPLREISIDEWPSLETRLPDPFRKRARHVVSENARVLAFVEACERGDLAAAGELMRQSHQSLSRDYEVSCEELDFLAASATASGLVWGARMTGGGFGGCTVNLVRRGAAPDFTQHISTLYEGRFGLRPAVYTCQTATGACELSHGE